MKKLIAIGAIAAMTLFTSGIATAEVSDSIPVVLNVGQIFSLAIGETALDLGELLEGETGGDGLPLYCRSNRGVAWRVQVKSSTILGRASAATIPLTNFKFNTYPLPDGGGTDSAGTFTDTPTALTESDQEAYAAAASEYSDTDVRLGLGLSLLVPYNTVSDIYDATVTCTITE